MKSPLVSAAIALFFAVSDCYDGWEKTWAHEWLTPHQATVAKRRMDKSLIELAEERKAEMEDKKQKLDNKFKIIDFKSSPIKQRLLPLCRFFATLVGRKDNQLTLGEKQTCSCFFVRPNIVMTAAHCVFPIATVKDNEGKEKQEPIYTKPEYGYVTFVVSDYGIEGDKADDHATQTKLDARLVVEWWTPQEYGYGRVDRDPANQLAYMDVAFLKVANPVSNSQHLILTQPVGPLGGESGAVQCNFFKSPSAMLLGYPAAYKKGEVALSVAETAQPEGTFTLFRANLLGTNWWFTKGSVGKAASGGPFIMGENSKGMPPECGMGVFGLNQGGFGDTDHLCRNYSPMITKQLIQALNIIEKVPLMATNVGAVLEGMKVTHSHKCSTCAYRTLELSVA